MLPLAEHHGGVGARGRLATGPRDDTPPQRIGKYTFNGNLGSGGFGRVYSALDPTVGRVVAIKVLNAPGDPDIVRRFRAEAKTVANLHHKNIVTVHEFGEDAGIPYLVMEYLEGATLQELIRQKSLSILEKLEIMLEVAEALRYAHERGVTHRDVKPANIMRLADGAVKIMDFGIARLAADSATRLTQAGFLLGSMDYMAPEQFQGTVDAVCDIFAYGVTFYELLTGEHPFRSSTPGAVVYNITHLDPPAVRSLVPDCPEALEQVIARTLAKSRTERYSSLSDVLVDTRPILVDLRRVRADELFGEARQLAATEQWGSLRSAVRKILDLNPMHAGARALRREADEAMRGRDLLVVSNSLVDRVEQELLDRQYEQAAGLLTGIQQLSVRDSRLQTRIEQAEARIEAGRKCARLLDDARTSLDRRDLPEAFRTLSEVTGIDPGNSQAQSLLSDIRARMSREARRMADQEVARVIVEARSLLDRNRAADALAAIRACIEQYGDNLEMRKLAVQAEAQVRALSPAREEPEPVALSEAPGRIHAWWPTVLELWQDRPWVCLAAVALVVGFILFWSVHSLLGRGVRAEASGASLVVAGQKEPFSATTGRPFSQSLTVSGNLLPVSWSIVEGSLPPGLTLHAKSGVIGGTPSAAGPFTFVVRAADSASHTSVGKFAILVAKAAAVTQTPKACQPAPFDLSTYADSHRGEFVWTGSLATDAQLDIQHRRSSAGRLSGDTPPDGVPVIITVSPGTIRKTAAPAASNCWSSGLSLRNEGPATSEIRFAWAVFQP